MSELASRECIPCKRGDPPLGAVDIAALSTALGGDWQVINQHHLEKTFKFPNFREALGFTNRVGELAEQSGHHPDLLLAWGKVTATIWTHRSKGLTESDFILAAKIDQLAALGASRANESPTSLRSPESEIMTSLARLAGGISHELNNLLTIVQGNAALLEDLPKKEDEHFVREILKATGRASQLSSQLHLFSGLRQIEAIPIDFGLLLANLRSKLTDLLGPGIALQFQCDPALPPALADAPLIEECLAKLASDARQTMKGSGSWRIKAQTLRVEKDKLSATDPKHSNYLLLEFQDTGPTLSNEELGQLFEPFVVRQGIRRGLDLPVVFGIVHQHRGWIEAHLGNPTGTVLQIYLPAA